MSLAFEFARWLPIDWLPLTLMIVATMSVVLVRRETSGRCVLYGALCGAIGFPAGALIVGLIHPSLYDTPLGPLVLVFLPLVGAWYGALVGAGLFGCISAVRFVSRDKAWGGLITRSLVLKLTLVLLTLLAVVLEVFFQSPRARWRTRTLEGHLGSVNSIAFHPQETTLASAGEDGTVRLWNPLEGSQLAVLKGHRGSVHTVAFAPDGTQLASGGADMSIKLWDSTTGEVVQTLSGHAEEVTCLAFSPEGRHLASASYGEVKLWQLAGGKEVASFVWPGETSTVDFAPDGQTLAVVDKGRPTIKILDAMSLSEIETSKLEGHQDTPHAASFSPDGRYLATGGGRGDRRAEVFLWDANNWTFLRRLRERSFVVLSLAFSPDGTVLATGSREDTVRLWNVESGKENVTLRGHSYRVQDVAFSPNGEIIAAAGPDGAITIWTLHGRLRRLGSELH